MDKEDQPPKTVKAQLVRLDDNLKQIERKQFAGIQRAPGSLPVLEAFQVFLENERKKAQKKLFIITGIAVFAVLFAVVSGGLYIRNTLRGADARTDSLAYTTAELEQSLGNVTGRQQTTEDRLVRTARHLSAQRRSLAEQAERLEEQQEMMAAERSERDAEITQLREQVDTLLETQASLQEMIATRPGSRRPIQRQLPAAPAMEAPEPTLDTTEPEVSYEILRLSPDNRSAVRWMFPTVTVPE